MRNYLCFHFNMHDIYPQLVALKPLSPPFKSTSLKLYSNKFRDYSCLEIMRLRFSHLKLDLFNTKGLTIGSI